MFKTRFRNGRRRTAVAVALATVVPLLALAGCGAGSREERLRSAADSLLPPEARMVGERYGDCTELAASPSCVTVFFAAPVAGLSERVRIVRDRARAANWDPRPEGSWLLPGGAGLAFTREGFRAFVGLSRRPAADCGELPLLECVGVVDHVQVRFD